MTRSKSWLLVSGAIVLGTLIGALALSEYRAWASGASSEAAVVLASEASSKGQLSQAEALAYDAIAANPSSHIGYVALADVFQQRSELAAARAALERALLLVDARSGNSAVLKSDERLWDAERNAITRKLETLPRPAE